MSTATRRQALCGAMALAVVPLGSGLPVPAERLEALFAEHQAIDTADFGDEEMPDEVFDRLCAIEQEIATSRPATLRGAMVKLRLADYLQKAGVEHPDYGPLAHLVQSALADLDRITGVAS